MNFVLCLQTVDFMGFVLYDFHLIFYLLTRQWNRCSVKPSESAKYSVAEMSSQASTKRVQTVAINQFRWKRIPVSNYSWKVRL